MNRTDPNGADMVGISAGQHEWTVEEVVQMRIGEATAAETPTVTPIPVPEKPPGPALPPLPKRTVSGRYRSNGAPFQLELRVDVDRTHPLGKVSGDYYQIAGATVTYFGSLIVDAPTITVTATNVVIEGTGKYTFTTSYPKIRVTIPRAFIIQPAPPATVQFFTLTGAAGAVYVCPFVSSMFRTVLYERDLVSDVTTPPFSSYNTGSLPSGGPARVLKVESAYAEAGIEMQDAGTWDTVPMTEEGPDAAWDNAELHASMVKHFSMWKDEPQWKVWELVAQKHVLGPGLLGIMFDQQGCQRQGCAVFHAGLGGATPDKLRLQLFCYVHELGHCFNLMHSWQKSFATPPGTNRPSALSWMNYPWLYPAGEASFWNAFAFAFDDGELVHVRHAFRNNIIMGGNPFGIGAGMQDSRAFADPIADESGLKFEIAAHKSFAYGEPIVLELELKATDMRAKGVHPYVHPNFGLTKFAIQKPGGQVLLYEPVIEHCVAAKAIRVDAISEPVTDSAYIGFGKGGFYFDQPGLYSVRAIYNALDGSQVVSNLLKVRVRHPASATDEDVADLFLGEEQGMLLYLLGSDSESLKRGNDAFDLVLDKYAKHPLAVYARLLKGINAGRVFKTVSVDRKLEVRKPKHDHSIQMLKPVVDAPEAMAVDRITLDMALRRLALAQDAVGDKAAAAASMDRTRRKTELTAGKM